MTKNFTRRIKRTENRERETKADLKVKKKGGGVVGDLAPWFIMSRKQKKRKKETGCNPDHVPFLGHGHGHRLATRHRTPTR